MAVKTGLSYDYLSPYAQGQGVCVLCGLSWRKEDAYVAKNGSLRCPIHHEVQLRARPRSTRRGQEGVNMLDIPTTGHTRAMGKGRVPD